MRLRRSLAIWSLVLLLLVFPAVVAQVNDYNNYSHVDMRFYLESNFTMIKQGSRARVESVSAELSFYPIAEMQKVQNLRVDAVPEASVVEKANKVTFTWKSPTAAFFKYWESADVGVESAPFSVKQKVVYPIDPVYNEFTQATEFIDITPEIQTVARELAAGEEDVFVVVFKIAEWVERNIKYDLTTLTAPVVQKSSWVLQQREGVCDELTNLFISMVRSRGIPARYVSGVAYTNVGYRWGPHAWAEVFFPRVGWVPFDITYGQFGWVDPSHIKLKVAADSGEASVKYTWKALDTKFKSSGVVMRVDAQRVGPVVPRYVTLSVRPLVNKVGPGSYVPIEVVVKNTQQAYVPMTLAVTKAQELTEKNVKRVLLLPGEEQKVYWFMRVPSDLDPGFNYYSFVEVQDMFHQGARTNVTYGAGMKVYSLDDAQKIVGGETVEQTYAKFVDVDCAYNEYAFAYEKIPIKCTIHNAGELPLQDLRVCLEKECTTVTIPAKQASGVQFELGNQPLGLQRYELLLENRDVRKIERLFVNVLANPDMIVTDFQVPEEVGYGEEFQMSFVMNVKAPVKDVTAFANGQRLIVLPDLLNSKRLIIKTIGSEYVREQGVNLTIRYKDHNRKEYAVSQKYPVRVVNVPLFIRIFLFLRLR